MRTFKFLESINKKIVILGIFWVYGAGETFRRWHPFGKLAVESRRELGLQTTPYIWQVIYRGELRLPTQNHLPSRKAFRVAKESAKLMSSLHSLLSSLYHFFFQLTEAFKLLELKMHNLVLSILNPSLLWQVSFSRRTSCSASHIPVEFLSGLSLEEVFWFSCMYLKLFFSVVKNLILLMEKTHFTFFKLRHSWFTILNEVCNMVIYNFKRLHSVFPLLCSISL